jgi:ergothioneine biosynthesis protein EgtB
MPDASPTKWHLAHTSWFFETFVVADAVPDYRPQYPQYGYLFNSYYNSIGERTPRDRRGTLSRPTVEEAYRYRAAIDEQMAELFHRIDDELLRRLTATIVLGLNHEQQHQELILTDIKHAFGSNPLRPSYLDEGRADAPAVPPLEWLAYPEALRWVGHDGNGFAFDNETPRHRVFVAGFQMGSRLVTNREYLAFVEDGGYERATLWLADGWDSCRTQQWAAPLYWELRDDRWLIMTLAGMRELDLDEPVCHVSYYEADAFARWVGARLPTEAEWEAVASGRPAAGNLLETGHYHPVAATLAADTPGPAQLFGDVWEWTQSPYTPYPGYRPASGALGEYNGKFMCNQMVLRGGSCVTPRSHIRTSYRNFFPGGARWQFTGIRLAKDL